MTEQTNVNRYAFKGPVLRQILVLHRQRTHEENEPQFNRTTLHSTHI